MVKFAWEVKSSRSAAWHSEDWTSCRGGCTGRAIAQCKFAIIRPSKCILRSEDSRSVCRRYSAPLREGRPTAHLFTETTVHRYIADLTVAKKWFRANVDQLLEVYNLDHPVQKEDLILGEPSPPCMPAERILLTHPAVIGTLDAANYALFVSHDHPDGQVSELSSSLPTL